MSNAPIEPAPARLRTLMCGYMVTQCLAVVARLGIADELAAGAASVEDLAKRTDVDPDALFRVLRALAGLGVFEETSPRVFAQTELSAPLQENARPSMRHLALLFGGDMYQVWGSMFDSVKSGSPSFAKVFGHEHFAYLSKNPASLATFTKAMAGTARGRVDALMEVDWAGTTSVVDVGGGDGTLLLELLAKQPALSGTVFDLPELQASAGQKIASAGLDARCSFRGGSFLGDDPPAADAYVLARVLHNWSDAHARAILARIRSAAKPGARIVIIDDVLAEGGGFETGKLLDLQMLVVLGGRERTAAEWRSLLSGSGFEVTSLRRDPRFGLVEGRAV